MIISDDIEKEGMYRAGEAVALTLRKMKEFAKVGMTTGELDDYGRAVLESYGAQSAPFSTYGFPGCTCISVNNEIAHGVPSYGRVLKNGDLVNIDVSAGLNGFCSDNGASFVLGADTNGLRKLVDISILALYGAISVIREGAKISEVGRTIGKIAGSNGYKVIRNLGGHGIGRTLHEEPDCILNYYDGHERRRFRKNMVVAVETFLTTGSSFANTQSDGWTLTVGHGKYCVQHEHTVIVTSGGPVILTEMNGIPCPSDRKL